MSITTTAVAGSPATDLARLLRRQPDAAHRVTTAFGEAHVFFPEADADRCTVALLLEVDPDAVLRRGSREKGRDRSPTTLDAYVDDRPFAVSSLFAAVLRTALRVVPEDAADGPRPLWIDLPAVRADQEPDPDPHPDPGPVGGAGGAVGLVRRLFEPLGWQVTAAEVPLDAARPDAGGSPYVRLGLAATTVRLADALRQLAVLLPVLDGAAHHWFAPERADVDKLSATHPERELIARRLARHEPESEPEGPTAEPGLVAAVLAALHAVGAARVVELGCGRGALLAELSADDGFTELLGVDAAPAALAAAARRLGLERTAEQVPEWASRRFPARVRLVQGAPVYADARLKGFDAVVLADPPEWRDAVRRPALEFAVFGAARPAAVVVTAPPGGDEDFPAWAERVAAGYGYTVTLDPVDRPERRGQQEQREQRERQDHPPRLALFERGTPKPGGGGPR
ncbi:3' terminal RNA ribose 2'-O-methyltransferase Hen1 [Kitasatospora sp. NPDC093806]|uniref:3' terminal RNA ribose 2'-O-methyltransferase Hen1 n=1 Tax=Kitasatospora sp. NPDC093806 TaxID=3155075 RepID=UPI003426B77A